MAAHRHPRPLRTLVFSASLRGQSLNSRLGTLVANSVQARGCQLDRASMQEFDCPSYDQDLQDESGFPPQAEEFRKRLDGCDAVVIASPEYNSSLPGVLKNAIDWVSRFQPQPFQEKQLLLVSASPSMVGGNRGLWALRVPLEHLGARVYPEMFSLAQAHTAFDEDGRLRNEQIAQRLQDTLDGFLDLAEAARDYPCVKARWYEFLGERPDSPATERMQAGAA